MNKEDAINAKLAKTLHRFETRIKAGDYYEAHQTLRTIANRYVNSKSYDHAIELIYQGAQSFLTAKQGGSGTDLIFYLLEVYELAQTEMNDDSMRRLIRLMILLDPQEPNVKDVATGMNNWTIKAGSYKFGDPWLHDIIALKLWEGKHVYEAERFFQLGTEKSVDRYVQMMFEWFDQASEEGAAPEVDDYFSRLTFNYLFIQNIRFVNQAKEAFLTSFINKYAPKVEITEKNLGSGVFKMYYFESYKSLNFLQLLVLTCQTKNRALFSNLQEEYSNPAAKYADQLAFLGQEYFGIIAPKHSNFLQDMMSGLLGSGGK
ncbi:hypothetical protein NCAS_0F00290 [Naumovozyma castellii]|uniref:Golgi to ER traffic protein 4 n=1 Tax=Naumovozyma castellii TaxID=27288 RepID=G0VG93_NAUCA|nr:hypothetical protein NCAS_0F00290 [Naumovozyma castellii CBS 4309]CCC70513.1 hypothetical protein NCAS_0F00290 [Naumovozyma castellii CBS 4309]